MPDYTVGHYSRNNMQERDLPALLSPKWIFDTFRDLTPREWLSTQTQDFYPYDVFTEGSEEQVKCYIIEAALAGVSKDNIHINVKNKTLQIEVDSAIEGEEENRTYIRKGISHKKAHLSFKLNTDLVDVDAINSTYKDGLLTVRVPVRKQEIKNIDVQVNID
jgi:HSP20 family molecular chaperone IbpA